MDLKSVLNPEANDKHASNAQKRPLPPPLSTRQPTHNGPPSFESPNRITPTVAYSPSAPHSANSHVTTPHSVGTTSFVSPYNRNAPLPSPGGTIPTATAYFAPGQRPTSNHSIARNSSSSPFEQRSYNAIPSPSVNRERDIPQHQADSITSYTPHPQTPLGPPALPRADSSNYLRESPLPYGRHGGTPSGTSYDYSHRAPRTQSHPNTYSAAEPGSTSSQLNGSPSVTRLAPDYMSRRNSSLSVSPKTILEPLPSEPLPPDSEQLRRSLSMSTPIQSEQPSVRPSISSIPTPLQSEQPSVKPSISSISTPVRSELLAMKPSFSTPNRSEQPSVKQSVSSSSTTTHDIEPMSQSSQRPSFPATQDPKPPGSKLTASASRKRNATETPPQPVPSKRPRITKDPPIWAHPKTGLKPIRHAATMPTAAVVPTPSAPVVGVMQQAGNPIADRGWEPTFTNIIPFEDITRQVCHFLFNKVISGDRAAPYEIEAKIGRICEGGTYDRIRVPVTTEAILSESNDITFVSQLQVDQHKALNDKLNECVLDSKRPSSATGKTRIPMEYTHTREIDSFFELSLAEMNALPEPARHWVRYNSTRHKPKVRVTRDGKTGNVLAAIVKSRIADLNVYCPQSEFDYRISVNIEQNYDGDINALARPLEMNHQTQQQIQSPDRRKDRLSYRHQFCQIDLTQVKSDAKEAKASHELEVEIDTAALREQGQLTAEGKPSRYEDYVKVFLDNVRTLARAVPKSLG